MRVHGIDTPSSDDVVAFIRTNPGATCLEIGGLTGGRGPNATRWARDRVKALVAAGRVYVQPDSEDKRVRRYYATD